MWRLYERWAVCLDWVSGEAFRSGPTVPAEEPRTADEIPDHFSDNAARLSLCATVCFVIAEKCPTAGGEGLCVHTWTLVQLV